MARNPQRIQVTLELLRQAWERFPDQRLGQLIINACRGRTPAWPDVFNVEDDDMTAGLRGIAGIADTDEGESDGSH